LAEYSTRGGSLGIEIDIEENAKIQEKSRSASRQRVKCFSFLGVANPLRLGLMRLANKAGTGIGAPCFTSLQPERGINLSY